VSPPCRGGHRHLHIHRLNARHRSNIRAPPRPLPQDVCIQSVGICVARRDRKRFIASWGLRMSHICPCTPCPSPQGYRSKVESRHFAHHCPPGSQRPLLLRARQWERVQFVPGYCTFVCCKASKISIEAGIEKLGGKWPPVLMSLISCRFV
jgi:hypothetical protein